MLLTDLVNRYWRARQRDLSQNTYNDYSRTFTRLSAWLESEHHITEVDAITADHIDGYLNHLKAAGLKPKTILNQHVGLSSLWTYAAKFNIPQIIHQVNAPTVHRDQPTPYTKDELERMLRACAYSTPWRTRPETANKRPTAIRDRAIIMVLVDTGLRASELCTLTVADYNPRRGDLLVQHGKGDKERTVPLGNRAADALDDYLTTRQPAAPGGQRRRRVGDRNLEPTAPLFATSTGEALSRYELLHMIHNCAERASVEGANIHRFRHTFAINYLRKYPNIYTLQRVLGHSTLDTVRIYLQISDTDIHEAHKSASVADNWRL